MHILILTPGELTVDPRARRAAAVAVRLGLLVEGTCPAQAAHPPVALEHVHVSRSRGTALAPAVRGSFAHGPTTATENPALRELRGLYRLARLLVTTVTLLRAAWRRPAPDIVHANDLDTLLAGFILARRCQARLVYDAHELYSSFEVDPPRIYRAVMLQLESTLARRSAVVVTVSEPIADELVRRLSLEQRPLAVLNCPPRTAIATARAARDGKRVRAVYQGSLGRRRHLSDLLAALAAAPNVELTLLVPGLDRAAATSAATALGVAERLYVADAVEPARLIEELASHDIGLVIDRPGTGNVELALPNKLFEYLMAGLAVAVPDLPGMAPVVRAERVGVTYEAGNPDALGRAIAAVGDDPEGLAGMRRHAREAATARYCAEAQEAALARAWGLTVPAAVTD